MILTNGTPVALNRGKYYVHLYVPTTGTLAATVSVNGVTAVADPTFAKSASALFAVELPECVLTPTITGTGVVCAIEPIYTDR